MKKKTQKRTKKRNPQDTTLRNNRALRKEIKLLWQRMEELEQRNIQYFYEIEEMFKVYDKAIAPKRKK